MSPEVSKQKFDQANALYSAQRYAEALQLLNELEAAHPLTQNIMYPRALCLAALNQHEEAYNLCEQLEMFFADTRVAGLKTQLQSAMGAAGMQGSALDMGAPAASAATPAAAPAATQRPAATPRAAFPVKKIAILLIVLGLGAAGGYYFMNRGGGSSEAPSGGGSRTPVARESTGEAEAKQKRIEEAMQRQLERSDTPPFMALYDTGTASPTPLATADLKPQDSWTEVGEEDTEYAFQGDAVMMNNRLMVVIRKEGAGAEVCGREMGNRKVYATLIPSNSSAATSLDAVKVLQCGQDAVILEATYKTGGSNALTVQYEMVMGQIFVKVTPGENAERLRVEAPSRFAVLPDFFADDIVVDAKNISAKNAEIPSENFLMHMVDDGNAIVMNVWENREQDVKITQEGVAGKRVIQSSEVAFGEEGAVWVSLLTSPGVWHMKEIKSNQKGREIPLNWWQPYVALWRVDWQRTDRLTDSWEMMTEPIRGEFKKHGLFEETEDEWTEQDWWGGGHPRMRIASGLGRFHYPCWIDYDGRGFLEPIMSQNKKGHAPPANMPEFAGPAIIYPLNRLEDTPLDEFTVVDVVRTTLGVGPCQYILDIEGQSEDFQGLPTCTIQDILDEIYEKGQQKSRQADVERCLVDVIAFITVIRNRIDDYGDFADETLDYLDEARSTHPNLSALISEMEDMTQRVNTLIDKRREGIRSIKEAEKLVKGFKSDVLGKEGSEAVTACKEYTSAWVGIGGNQDELVAECRVAVKLLRQSAAMALTQNPDAGELVGEIRARTESILRNPVNYEAPRH